MKMVSTTGMELAGFTVSMLCMCESEPTQTPWQSTRISQKGSIQSGVVLKDYHKPDFRANNQGKHYYKYIQSISNLSNTLFGYYFCFLQKLWIICAHCFIIALRL